MTSPKTKKSSIMLTEATRLALAKLKIHDREPYEDVVKRIIEKETKRGKMKLNINHLYKARELGKAQVSDAEFNKWVEKLGDQHHQEDVWREGMKFEFGVMSSKWKLNAPDLITAKIAMALLIEKDIPIAIYEPHSEAFLPREVLTPENLSVDKEGIRKAFASIKKVTP